MPGTTTTIAAGEISSGIVTTTVGQVDTVNFGRDVDQVLVMNYDGADWLFFTTDGSTPTVGGKNCFAVVPGAGAGLVVSVGGGGQTAVKLISATATKYLVFENQR